MKDIAHPQFENEYSQYGSSPYENHEQSIALQKLAQEQIPEATSSNHRGQSAYHPYPMIYMDEAEGVTLTDVDGNKYIDYHCGVSAIISGHAPDHQQSVIRDQIERGPYFATSYENEYKTAKLLNELVPGSERVKFMSTGTEAIMTAIRIARAYTGKEKILTFEGMYHGHSDYTLLNVHTPPTALGTRRNPNKVPEENGIPETTLRSVESIPWNDIELISNFLQRKSDSIAAVITEATMSNSGLIWPNSDYLSKLRELAREHDVLFILDEVVTGFRIGLGGAQEFFDITPDMAIYGKALANGYPISAITGTNEVMEYTRPDPDKGNVMGTFSGHPISVAAAKGNLEILDSTGPKGYEKMRGRGENLFNGMVDILKDDGHNVYAPRFAGFSFLHFLKDNTNPNDWTEWRDVYGETDKSAYESFAGGMIGQGIFLPPKTGRINLTHAHNDDHIEAALEATKIASNELA